MKADQVKIAVTLLGVRPIMFDRYGGDNKTVLAATEKVYLGTDGKTLIMPSINILSFLSAQNRESATQRVIGRGWKTVAKSALSFAEINPIEIPFTRNGETLTMDNAGIRIMKHVAIVMKGKLAIPNPKERPVLDLPWELSFDIVLYRNDDLNAVTLRKIFEGGGRCIGLGSFRGVFGKFIVQKWNEVD